MLKMSYTADEFNITEYLKQEKTQLQLRYIGGQQEAT